jgi:TRAP-type transport system periplasmic protein
MAGLTTDLRRIAAQNIDAAGASSRTGMAKMEQSARQRMAAYGLVFNDRDQEPFHDALEISRVYAELRGRYGEGAWRMLEKYPGALG